MDPGKIFGEILAKMDLEEPGLSQTVLLRGLGFQDMTQRFSSDLRVLLVQLHVGK